MDSLKGFTLHYEEVEQSRSYQLIRAAIRAYRRRIAARSNRSNG